LKLVTFAVILNGGEIKIILHLTKLQTIQQKRKQKLILKYQTEIPIYELPTATKISSVFEWP
jgi:hypothetical protein